MALGIICLRAVRKLYSSLHSCSRPEAMSSEELDAFFAPPSTVRGLTSLDRGLFKRAIELPAVKLASPSLCSKFLSYLSHVVLKYPFLKRVVNTADVDGKVFKTLLLLPEALRPHPISPVDHDWIASNGGEETTHTVCLAYPQSYSHNAILRAVLPETVKEVPSGFEAIGHIAHFNLREEAMPFKSLIGQVTLDKHQLIKTVVNKTDQIDNTFRFFKMEVLAGEDNLLTTVNENGCSFIFDFSKVYWNSRLHSEHERLVELLPKDGLVIDVFSGVGPFSIPAAKKGCSVYANDLNPHSYKYLCANAKKNNVLHKVITYNLDGKEFIRKMTANFIAEWMVKDRVGRMYTDVIMNLPAIAHTFLDAFRGLFSNIPLDSRAQLPLPRIHCYCFSKSTSSPEQDSLKMVAGSLGVEKLIEGTYSVGIVRKVAPNKTMTRVSFQLPDTVAYAEVEEEEMIKCEQTLSKSVNDIESELPSAKRTRIE